MDGLTELDGLMLADGDTDALALALTEPEGLTDADGDTLAEGETDAEGLGLRLIDGLTLGETLALADGETDGLGPMTCNASSVQPAINDTSSRSFCKTPV